eukprot:Stramenopile-MAST_4_protein_1121
MPLLQQFLQTSAFALWLALCFEGADFVKALNRTCDVPTTGSVEITQDCVLYQEVVVTGTLTVIGVPNVHGVMPKIIGGGSNRLFKVVRGGALVVKRLNLTGGDVTILNTYGGAIYADGGRVNATETAFIANKADRGGAIGGSTGSTLILSKSRLVSNTAVDTGGAIHLDPFSSLRCFACEMAYNVALGAGGGALYSKDSSISVSRSTVAYNEARSDTEPRGGGVLFSQTLNEYPGCNTFTEELSGVTVVAQVIGACGGRSGTGEYRATGGMIESSFFAEGTLDIHTGCKGQDGSKVNLANKRHGGGGGGSTAISLNGVLLMEAGGGGGAGQACSLGGVGGGGGGTACGSCGDGSPRGGGGGTQTQGGFAGIGNRNQPDGEPGQRGRGGHTPGQQGGKGGSGYSNGGD